MGICCCVAKAGDSRAGAGQREPYCCGADGDSASVDARVEVVVEYCGGSLRVVFCIGVAFPAGT